MTTSVTVRVQIEIKEPDGIQTSQGFEAIAESDSDTLPTSDEIANAVFNLSVQAVNAAADDISLGTIFEHEDDSDV